MPYDPIGRFGPQTPLSHDAGAWVRQEGGGYLFERQGVVGRDGEIRSANFSETDGTGWRLRGNGQASFGLGVLGHAEITSSQTGISTLADITGLTVTVNVPSGRRLRITGHAQFATDTATAVGDINIHEGSTRLGRAGRHRFAANNSVTTLHGSAIVAPSSGSHTYKLTAATSAGTVDVQAAASIPAFILVEDIGPA